MTGALVVDYTPAEHDISSVALEGKVILDFALE